VHVVIGFAKGESCPKRNNISEETGSMNMRTKTRVFCALVIVVLLCCTYVSAEAVTIRESLAKAIDTNPEVQSKWHALQASSYDITIAKAGMRPKLDAYATIGKYSIDGAGWNSPDNYNYTPDGAYLTLTQALYDGLFTRNQVKHYSFSKKMKYFDMVSSMEQVALAAYHSHEDVLRYRMLTKMAEDNLEHHKVILDKVAQRAKSGLESKVNLDTAKGRVSLANVNLLTQKSNLHDTVTQYIRVVGEAPDAVIEDDNEIDKDFVLPATEAESTKAALSGNPQLFSYKENEDAMKWYIQEQASHMRPRLDFRAGVNLEHDIDGTNGRKDKSFIELILRYNLYNGGIDQANISKAMEGWKQAGSLVSKVQRDVTQSVLVSYNDIQSIQKQLDDLRMHKNAADSMRTAYLQQFEAGRRSLLDLLDVENEYFQADIAYANALFDLKIAKASYLAATGKLLAHYGIFRKDVPEPAEVGIDVNAIANQIAAGTKKK